MAAILQPRPPDVFTDGYASFAEQHVQVALGAAERGGDLVNAEVGVAQMFADKGMSLDIHRFRADPIEGCICLAKRQ